MIITRKTNCKGLLNNEFAGKYSRTIYCGVKNETCWKCVQWILSRILWSGVLSISLVLSVLTTFPMLFLLLQLNGHSCIHFSSKSFGCCIFFIIDGVKTMLSSLVIQNSDTLFSSEEKHKPLVTHTIQILHKQDYNVHQLLPMSSAQAHERRIHQYFEYRSDFNRFRCFALDTCSLYGLATMDPCPLHIHT